MKKRKTRVIQLQLKTNMPLCQIISYGEDKPCKNQCRKGQHKIVSNIAHNRKIKADLKLYLIKKKNNKVSKAVQEIQRKVQICEGVRGAESFNAYL